MGGIFGGGGGGEVGAKGMLDPSQIIGGPGSPGPPLPTPMNLKQQRLRKIVLGLSS